MLEINWGLMIRHKLVFGCFCKDFVKDYSVVVVIVVVLLVGLFCHWYKPETTSRSFSSASSAMASRPLLGESFTITLWQASLSKKKPQSPGRDLSVFVVLLLWNGCNESAPLVTQSLFHQAKS